MLKKKNQQEGGRSNWMVIRYKNVMIQVPNDETKYHHDKYVIELFLFFSSKRFEHKT